MSIGEIIPALRDLSRSEKFQPAQMLLDDLASDEQQVVFQEGAVYPICTPEYAPLGAAQLALMLMKEGARP